MLFLISMLAALLRALFFAFQRLQRYCEHCFLRFIACSVTASTVFCVLSLAALLRALFFAFHCLQRYCEHQIFCFEPCSLTASIKIFVFIFAERRCVFGMVGVVPVCPPERLRSGVSIPKYICASRIMNEDLTMDAPLQGDTGRHTGTAPTKLHHTLQSAHNQRPLRPHSCKTIHHLEMNERQGPCVRRIPTPSRIELVVTRESSKSRAFVYFCTAKTKSDRGGGPTRICESTLYFRERYI